MAADQLELLSPLDDALRRAAGGDHEAFAELVRSHQDMVFSIAWHFFHDRDHAEEIAQDVFLRLYRALGEIGSAAHLLFWLRKVTANRCIDEKRRVRMHAVSIDEIPEVAGYTTPGGDPLLGRRLRALLLRLPPPQRLAITLRYQEQLEPMEICTVLGLPLNTVKSHLQRGLTALRSWLGPFTGSGEGS
jgi:RNA polymerase sigma-70 factor (ECF subfamily)